MGHQIQRKVERRDGENRADREAAAKAPAPGGGFEGVEWNVLAIDSGSFFRRDSKGVNTTVNLDAGDLDWLAGFLADGAGKLFASRAKWGRRAISVVRRP